MNQQIPVPMTVQPGAQNIPLLPRGPVIWMQRPNPVPGVPTGLEYLLYINYLRVSQVPSLLETFTGWETNNKYGVYNSEGMMVFYAMEDTDSCMRICCGANRGFTIYIVDNFNQQVMKITRDFKCCGGCACCSSCAHEIVIQTIEGKVLGYVVQKCSFCTGPKFDILNENRDVVLTIKGPCCILDGPCCPKGTEFKILSVDGTTEVGIIKKEYSGFVREMYTNADNFSISFPVDMSVSTKATLIGATFLIDFMFFEYKNKNN